MSDRRKIKTPIGKKPVASERIPAHEDEFTPYRVRKHLERMWQEEEAARERAEQARTDRLADMLEEQWPDIERRSGERKAAAEERKRAAREAYIQKGIAAAKRLQTRVRNGKQARLPECATQGPRAQIFQFPDKRVAAGADEPDSVRRMRWYAKNIERLRSEVLPPTPDA